MFRLAPWLRLRCFSSFAARKAPTLEHLWHPLAQGEVFLVGTSHISAESADEVRQVVRSVRPQHVMVELCMARRQRLEAQRLGPDSCSILPGSVFEEGDFLEAIKMFYQLLRSAGFDPGQDMLAGLDSGKEVGARLHCGDVEGKVTEERLKAEFLAVDHQQLMLKLMRPEVQREASQVFPDMEGLDLAAMMRGDKKVAAAFAKASERMKDREKALCFAMPAPNGLPDSKSWQSWGLEKAEKIDQGVEDVESPIEGVVVDWAGEAKPVAEGIKVESRQVRRCGSRRCCFALSCCGFSMVAIITICALFWPRDPQWKLVNLEILSEDTAW
eukprot:s20_g5.t1